MKKLTLWLIATLFLSVYVLSLNESFMRFFVSEWTNEKRPLFAHMDRYKYGDLYGISYIDGYSEIVAMNYHSELNTADFPGVNISVIGDSYLMKTLNSEDTLLAVDSALFCGFRWYTVDHTKLPPIVNNGNENVLLIEMSERFIPFNLSSDGVKRYKEYLGLDSFSDSEKQFSFQSRIVPDDVEQNIETLLFGYEMFAPLKKMKSAIKRNLLEEDCGQVYEDRINKRLYLRGTIDRTQQTSSFYSFKQEQIVSMVQAVLELEAAGRQAGFERVIFSFIPNSATIIPPSGMKYGGLLDSLQFALGGKVEMVDSFTKMKQFESPEKLYWRSDTHWTSSGFLLWLREFEKVLRKCSASDSTDFTR